MVIEKILLGINNCRKELKILYLVEQTHRNMEWHEKVQSLSNIYKNSLNDIKIGKINATFQKNILEIDKASGLLKQHQIENLMYNNKIARIRDLHPVFYIIKDNKIYFLVQTNQNVNIPKPLQDELVYAHLLKDSIAVTCGFENKYFANVVYVIEAKNSNDLLKIVENIDQNSLLKSKIFNNQNESAILYQKEKVFELFHKIILNKDSIAFNLNDTVFDMEDLNNNIALIHRDIAETPLLDVTFDKYIIDNIDRISNYENYRKDSWMEYLKLYEIEEINNKNDPTDI